MQAIDLKPLMEGAVAEVLEAMFFIAPEGDAADETARFEADWICSQLEFTGHPSGSFGISVPPQTAAMIAENFLGDEDSNLTSAQTVEVIGELTNMVCGTLLANLDSSQAFVLSPPRHDGDWFPAVSGDERIFTALSLDEGSIHVWLKIQASL
jgi:CheY-specific phosphatase CheX